MSILIAPSILSADFTRLGEEVDAVLAAGADWIHVDVMDGMFVPNITIGQPVVKSLRRHTDAFLDCHLMVERPERYVQGFRDAGADMITIHAEATPHVHRAIQQIKASGAKAGVAINPHTPITWLDAVLEDLDMVLVMSVNPGFGGQSFIPAVLSKISALRAAAEKRHPGLLIEVDGGVSPATIGDIVDAGADVFVAGSAIFRKPDYGDAIADLRAAAVSRM